MKTNFIVTGLALVFILASCKKPKDGTNGTDGTQGPSGPALTGNLKGYITHLDISGAKITTDLMNDSVSIDGAGKSAATDVNGMFTFSGITTGVYNLTIKKSGSTYGWTKIQNVQFSGNGDTYRNASLSTIPTNSVNTIMAYDTTISSVNYVRIRGTLPSSTRAQSIMVFINNPGNTAPNSLNYSSSYAINVAANATVYSKNIPTTDLYDLGIVSGNTVYCAAYMIGSNTTASSYIDYTTNRTVYTAISLGYLTISAPVQ